MTDCTILNFDENQKILNARIFRNRKLIIQLFEQLNWPEPLIETIRATDNIIVLRVAIMTLVHAAKRQKKPGILKSLIENNLLVNSSRPYEHIKWQEEFLNDKNVVKG